MTTSFRQHAVLVVTVVAALLLVVLQYNTSLSVASLGINNGGGLCPSLQQQQQELPLLKNVSNHTPPPVILYPQNPQGFTDTLVECLMDSKCHFLYHHVKKTAGFFIAGKLYPIFQNGDRYSAGKWCCYGKVMRDFWSRPSHYCVDQRMSILEVYGDDFEQALEYCETTFGGPQGHRYVALVSIREPIQRTISLVHQYCNKEIYKKNNTYKAFCQNCTYDDHSAHFWQSEFIDNTNRDYRTVGAYVEKRRNGNATSLSSQDHYAAPILVIDNSMVDNFFQRFNASLTKMNRPMKRIRVHRNVEEISVCNFGMKSAMLKLLGPSNEVFLNLWSGYTV